MVSSRRAYDRQYRRKNHDKMCEHWRNQAKRRWANKKEHIRKVRDDWAQRVHGCTYLEYMRLRRQIREKKNGCNGR